MHGRLRKEYEELARRSVPDETLPEPSAYERLSGSEQVLRRKFQPGDASETSSQEVAV
jgi:hypothetical protein